MRRAAPLAALLALGVGCVMAAAAGAAPTADAKPVLLLPLGNVDDTLVAEFAATMRAQLHLRVRVGQHLPLAANIRNPRRKQIIAELLVGYIRSRTPEARSDRVAVIGLTDEDMYPREPDWRWSFGERNRRAGVVSVARMDPRTFGLEPNRPLLLRRLRKFALRYGALLALGSGQTIEPRSALYGAILSVDDLDFVEPALAPRPYSRGRTAWLATARRECRRAGAVWQDAARRLPSMTIDKALPVFRRWAAADAALAQTLRHGSSAVPRGIRQALLGSLGSRAAYLREVSRSVPTLRRFDGRHMRSLGGVLHAAFLEAGSRPCAKAAS